MIPLPDPPLDSRPRELVGGRPRSGRTSPTGSTETGLALALRPWELADAPVLVAAWADPEIQRWTGVPERRDRAAAERWIAGDEARRARWLSLDLAVVVGSHVAGEVGLSSFDPATGTAEIGWWTAPDHRGRGIATTAAGLLVAWATSRLGLRTVIARCDAENPASVTVARASGAMVLT